MKAEELEQAAAAGLAAAKGAIGEGQPILVMVMDPVTSLFHWKANALRVGQLGLALGEILGKLAAAAPSGRYSCKLCGAPGQAHGEAPLDGWRWTKAEALVCPECQQAMAPAPVVQLVPRLDGALVEDDGPDLGQAPTNLGHGPVPLFLEGELDDLEELQTQGICRGGRSDEEMRAAVQEHGFELEVAVSHVPPTEGEASGRPVAATMPAVAPPVTNEADEAWVEQGSEQGAMGPAAVPTGYLPGWPRG